MFLSILALVISSSAASASSVDEDPRWIVLGCFISPDDNQFFSHLVKSAACMTRSYCYSQCQSKSYKYFGLKSGQRCYCDNYLYVRDAIKAPDRKCANRCGGNYREICGSSDAMVVMQIAKHPGLSTRAPGVGSPMGCFMSDEVSAALPHRATEASCMTQSFCRDECVRRSFQYFGLRLGTQCHCGNSLDGTFKTASDRCNWRCGGDHRERCGSSSGMLVSSVADLPTSSAQSSATTSAVETTDAPATTAPRAGVFQMLKLTSCNQGSVLEDATCDKAYDGNTDQDSRKGSCSQSQASSNGDTTSWWTARFARRAHVMEARIYNRADCCADKLNDFSIAVDRTWCARYRSSGSFSVRTFQCEANGTAIAIDSNLAPLTLCEVQVFGKYL